MIYIFQQMLYGMRRIYTRSTQVESLNHSAFTYENYVKGAVDSSAQFKLLF